MAFSEDQNSSVLIADWLRAWSILVVKIGYRGSLLYRGQFKLTIGCYFYTNIIVARPGKKYQEPLSCAFHANAS